MKNSRCAPNEEFILLHVISILHSVILHSSFNLDALFDVPDEGAETEHLIVFIDLAEAFHEWSNYLVFHHRDDGTVHGWPCVAAEMWVACFGAATLHLLKESVATHVASAEHCQHVLVLCLVVCYEY
jgi:hypothetical protein